VRNIGGELVTLEFLDTRRIMDEPALNGAVIDYIATLLHQLLLVPLAQRIGDVPPDAL